MSQSSAIGLRGLRTPTMTEGKLRLLRSDILRGRVGVGADRPEVVALGPAARLDAIAAQEGRAAALRYLAWALPEREAVWWACMCTLCLPAMTEAEAAVIEHARAWVRRPDEVARRASLALVREAGPNGAAGYVGRAVYTSRPDDAGAMRAGLSVASAVAGTLAVVAEVRREEAASRFVASACDIAAGGAGWIEGARRG